MGQSFTRGLNEWSYKRKTGTTTIGEATICPKCNRHFPSNTTYHNFNSHLDYCLGSNFAPPAENIPVEPLPPKKEFAGGLFYWKKVDENHGENSWEKVAATGGKNVNHNMALDKVAKLDYLSKLKWFRDKVEKMRIHFTQGADTIAVSKTDFYMDSIYKLRNCNLHKELKIEFEEEKVQDAGGLFREWIHLNIKELFLSKTGPFILADTDDATYRINPYYEDAPEYLDQYRHAGKIIGKSIFERIPLAAYLDTTLLNHMRDDKNKLADIEGLDKQIYKSLKYILENSIDNDPIFEEYFAVDDPQSGTAIELKPNGATIRVTDANKTEYVDLRIEWMTRNSIQKKLDAFLQELDSVIPLKFFSVFDQKELEMVINGVPIIDVDDWERNTVYKGEYNVNHAVVRWFWKAMRELNQEQLAKFLQFCTGSTRTPVEGFRVLESNRGNYAQFCIESVRLDKTSTMMRAHTCFNRLDLPKYPSYEKLKESLHSVLALNFEMVFGIKD